MNKYMKAILLVMILGSIPLVSFSEYNTMSDMLFLSLMYYLTYKWGEGEFD